MTDDNRLRLLYHYTSLTNVESIFGDRQLRTSRVPRWGPSVDVVWLTDATDPGRGRDHGLGGPEPAEPALDKRAVRFTVSVDDAQYWSHWSARHHVTRRYRRAVDERGGGLSARWWVVSRPIPIEEWVGVEDLRAGVRLWPEPSRAYG